MIAADTLGTGLTIIAASTLAPLLIYKLYIPWINKKGKKTTLPTVLLLGMNFLIYILWYYFISSRSLAVLLISVPLLLSLMLESLSLLTNNFRLFVEVVKVNAFIAIPYLLMNPSSDPILYLVIGHLLNQSLLYFTSYALLKSFGSKIPFAYELKSKLLDDKTFHKTGQYKSLKAAGIKQITIQDITKVVTKYGLVVGLLWIYINFSLRVGS